MDMPLVSVVMPTYNRRDLVMVAINSVLAQTFTDWELIIVDDGSIDDTQQIIAAVCENDPRVKYLHQSNQGQSVARNNGVETSQGKYIAFIDSDNAWLPNRLAEGVAVLNSDADIGLCYGDLIFIDINGNELHRRNMARHSGNVFSKLMADNFVSMNTVLVRKSVLPSHRPFNQSNRLDEDYELWLDMSVNNRYQYIPQYLAMYRVEGNRISNDFLRRLDGNRQTIEKIVKKYALSASDPRVRMGLSDYCVRRASVLSASGRWNEFLAAASEGLRYDSTNFSKFLAVSKLLLKKIIKVKR